MALSTELRILVADPLSEAGLDIMRRAAQVDVRTGLPPDELRGLVAEYDALVVRSQTKVTADLIDAAMRLQVIGRAGVGVDTIDVEAATRRGVVVVNAPSGNTISTAEHTMALMLALSRHVPQAVASLREGRWERSRYTGVELRNKTLGVFGLGRVGSEVARRARAFEMRVLGLDPFVSDDYAALLGIELAGFDAILAEADYLTVHTPLTDATRGLIGAEQLAMTKPGVRIINAARGGIVEEAALLAALEAGHVAGAALDVFTVEPPGDLALLRHERVIATPHLGASTAEAQENVALDVAHQIVDVLEGRSARYAVNTPLVAPEAAAALSPFLATSQAVGSLARQLVDGQPNALSLSFEGEIARYDPEVLVVGLLAGFMAGISEERVNLINARLIARQRGIAIVIQSTTQARGYRDLVRVEVASTAGATRVAGSSFDGEPRIVEIDDYTVDLSPTGGYWLLSHHLDRPGLIGDVGTITGKEDINISSMQVGRAKPRGEAMMILGLDEPIDEGQLKKLLAIPDIYSAKLVRL